MKTLLTTATLAALAVAAQAQVIYAPTIALADQKISLSAWGSGTITETTEMAYDGGGSVRVSSRNFFQGGIMHFENPVNLSGPSADKANMFLITLSAPAATTVDSGGAAGGGVKGGGGGATLGTGGGGGGAAAGLGGGAAGGQTGGGQAGGTERQVTFDTTLTKVRMIITTSDGKKSEVFVDLSGALANSRGWKSVGVPLVSIPGFDRTNKMVKSIAFSGDTIGTFYVGELKVVNDTTPLYVEPSVFELNLALGDEITLSAYGSGGSSQLRYTWDFDAADGVDVDAEGQYVRRRFRKPGNYTITVTVHDQFGLKKPHSSTIKVVVNP
jgi:hypothetical protein